MSAAGLRPGTTKQKIVKYIFQVKNTSKSEIATELSLSMPTVLSVIKDLTTKGIVRETGTYESTGGRRAKKITIVGDNRFAVGVDITANHINMVLLNFSGNVVLKQRLRVKFENSLEYFENIYKIIGIFIKQTNAQIKDKILGVGISLPGIIDKDHEILVKSHALQVERMSLKNLSQLIPYPVLYENDATSAALAEMRSDADNTVYLSLSNTVGGAIFLNGRIYEGVHYRGAEFGHMILYPKGKRCYCGRLGCVDAYCAAVQLSKFTDGDLAVFFEKVEKREGEFYQIWDEYLSNLAIAVSNLRIIFDCDVILGGYVGGYMEKYMSTLRKKVLEYNMFDEDVTFLRSCRIKNEASAVGIAMKFIDNYISNL